MRKISLLILLIVTVTAGCGSDQPQRVVIDKNEPLTLEVWNTMTVVDKYDFGTLEHLRASDPNLKTEAAWNRFMKDVVVPQRRKDIPTEQY
jgi:hypothetical protein